MQALDPRILTINAGSSTIKFAQFQIGDPLDRRLHGSIDFGQSDSAHLTFTDAAGRQDKVTVCTSQQDSAPVALLDWLEAQDGFASLEAIGHRVVHGMRRCEPEPVTPALLDELRRLAPDDPEHLPREIGLMEEFARRHPRLLQVACFDTTFHRTMPKVARVLPIPRRYQALGVERYGFHGLSFAYLMQALAALGDPAATTGRVILAHLGNGASMAAVLAGESIDTSMGFTPASGLPMGSRSGDLDPGLIDHLARTEDMTAAQFQHMVNHDSGLRGLSEISSDMRELLAREATDDRAQEAIAVFCYQAKKWIGAFSAALGGLDTLVFAGGIGEHAPSVRTRICANLDYLGLELDEHHNTANHRVISAPASRVTIRVMHTDEELMIATAAARMLGTNAKRGASS